MSDESTQEKVHESGLPKPTPTQLAHHYIHEWTIIPEENSEKKDESHGEMEIKGFDFVNNKVIV